MGSSTVTEAWEKTTDVAAEKDLARPKMIEREPETANLVNLVGFADQPVQFRSYSDGKSWAGTVISQSSALHVKKDDRIHIFREALYRFDSYERGVSSIQCPGRPTQIMVQNLSFLEATIPPPEIEEISTKEQPYMSSKTATVMGEETSNAWKHLLENPKKFFLEERSLQMVLWFGVQVIMVTGESVPVSKEVESPVIGGTINMHGALHMKATKVGSDAVLSQIISLVETAQMSEAPVQKFADYVASIFVPVVIILALFTLIGWSIGGAVGAKVILACLSVYWEIKRIYHKHALIFMVIHSYSTKKIVRLKCVRCFIISLSLSLRYYLTY
ncbi:unnamed protein product [Thlaspi arvense]|uniref:P-type ATPase A domain-containing protein n=1 Tax=Thlaspi arvense TaxID=13288 RepID=A0AAU9RMX6_THLAR|nr:unnamed protein product [Thlaspi arvense]